MRRLALLLAMGTVVACASPRAPVTPSPTRPARAQAARPPVGPDSVVLARLATAEAQWARWASPAYELHLENSCYCGPTAVLGMLTVRGDSVMALTDSLGAPLPDNQARRVRYTVPGLFRLMRRRAENPVWKVTVALDSIAGYPTRMQFDHRRVDDLGEHFVIRAVRPRR